MARNKLRKEKELNQIKKSTNVFFNIIFIILSALCIFPIVFVFSISISSETSIQKNGYQLIPQELSAAAYQFLWNERGTILHATFISILVTALGIILSVLLTTTMGYVVSRNTYKLKSFYTWVIFIPMIFNGGMLAGYVVNTNILHLRNSIWALILPLAVSPFNIVICKTFFKTTIPDSIVESAKIDGAGQLRIFAQIILPISKPIIATIALFAAFGYWNDWFNALLYISNDKLIPLQYLLMKVQNNLQFLTQNAGAGSQIAGGLAALPGESARMAIVIISTLPIAISYPFFQRYFVKGLTIGGVKE